MVAPVEQLGKYTSNWDKYKVIWETDKENFIRRYAKTTRTLEAFEADIVEKQENQKQIENEETITNISFIRLDCSPLKYSLIGHCAAWQNRFSGLLQQNAANDLRTLHEFFGENIKQLRVTQCMPHIINV
jgi:dynein heavy chain